MLKLNDELTNWRLNKFVVLQRGLIQNLTKHLSKEWIFKNVYLILVQKIGSPR